MLWNLKWGSSVKAFEARARKSGITPRPLLERPRLKKVDLPYQEAFLILHKARSTVMGASNPLSVTDILNLVCMGGIAYIGDRPKYLRLMQKLDTAYLDYQAEKAPKP